MKKLGIIMMVLAVMLLGIAGGIAIGSKLVSPQSVNIDMVPKTDTVTTRDYYIDFQEKQPIDEGFKIHFYGSTTTTETTKEVPANE